jgi:hypothetical protein
MSNIQVSNSNLINVSDTPTLPNIGYYDKDIYGSLCSRLHCQNIINQILC